MEWTPTEIEMYCPACGSTEPVGLIQGHLFPSAMTPAIVCLGCKTQFALGFYPIVEDHRFNTGDWPAVESE